MSTQGALYLAHERQALKVSEDEEEVLDRYLAQPDPRFHLTDCMPDRAVVQWWLVLREFGVNEPIH